jgi:hypothetical protein
MTITLSPKQWEALEALEWINSDSKADREALNIVRAIINDQSG